MSHVCKDCESLQVQPSSTAPERPQFQQPTKYDHYVNFQKFKEAQEKDLLINQHKKELLQFNPNFTDFNLNRVLNKDDFKQFSTQKVAKFRQQFSLGNCDLQLKYLDQTSTKNNEDKKNLEVEESSESDNKSLQKRKSLLSLTRIPVQCPISICNRTIGVTFVLSHFLRDHGEDFGVPCQEIYTGKRSVLVFDPTILEFRENVCLGILAYGGDVNER